jgi:serine O-acetyltransferase
LILEDLRAKARWCYEDDSWQAIARVLVSDGTLAMMFYRCMQFSRHHGLWPLELVFNKLNVVLCNCIIGRGAEFGPRFVLIHATGIVINGGVRGGAGIHLEHQVTIGAERRRNPVLEDGVFVGAGAKILGQVVVGAHARVGANAVVVKDVPDYATVVGIPAQVVRMRDPSNDSRRERI